MPIPSLPLELWSIVVMELGKKDHCSLALVSQWFYNLTAPILFKEFTFPAYTIPFCFEDMPLTKFAMTPSYADQRLLELLDSSQRHRNYIRRISLIKSFGSYETIEPPSRKEKFHRFIDAILSVITECPNLNSVTFGAIPLHSKVAFRLASRPLSSISIIIQDCTITGEPELDHQYTATDLECDAKDMLKLYPIVFSGSLRRLKLLAGAMDLSKPAQIFPETPSPLTSLRELCIPDLRSDIKWLFRLTPHLTSLSIGKVAYPLQTLHVGDIGKTLPRLQSFTGPSNLIHQLLTGRPVTSLETWGRIGDEFTDVSFSAVEGNFGSKEPIIKVHWDRCSNLGALMSYLASKCPSIEELTCSSNTRARNRTELLGHVNKLKKLKHLIRLKIRFGEFDKFIRSFPKDNSIWEHAQCKALCAEGCPDIQSIEFPSLNRWTRTSKQNDWFNCMADYVFNADWENGYNDEEE